MKTNILIRIKYIFLCNVFFSVRRLLHDDAFGVGEALNETAFGEGLVVRGKHR